MSDRPLPPRAPETIDALLSSAGGADEPLDEALLDALAAALTDAEAPGAPPAPTTGGQTGAPDGWGQVAVRLHLPTPPPGAGIDWDAVAAAYVRPPSSGADGGRPATAADPTPALPGTPAERRPGAWGRWVAVAGGGLLSAAVALFALRPVPWTIHPDELHAPRIPVTVRGEATAGPVLQALEPGPGPQPAGLIALRLRVQSARAVDQASLRLRSLRGEGRALDPAEGPLWTSPAELQVGLRLPPGVHPIEISVLDDLQREGALVVELEVR
jgi:hypothetical protein